MNVVRREGRQHSGIDLFGAAIHVIQSDHSVGGLALWPVVEGVPALLLEAKEARKWIVIQRLGYAVEARL